MSKRPDLIVHSDETVLRIMRCASVREVRGLALSLGVSPSLAQGWYYRQGARPLRLAEQNGLSLSIPTREKARPRQHWTERDYIRAVMAGDA